MHHAYVIVGSSHEGLAYLAKTWQIVEAPLVVTTLGIDHSRQIKEEQSRRVAEGEARHVILVCNIITLEAQNALLKTFEEPTPGVHLFLIIPDKTNILPTLLSRSELVELNSKTKTTNHPDPITFLKQSPETRITTIASFVDEHEETATLRRASQDFVRALIGELRDKRDHAKLAELDQALRYLAAPAGLPRLVLEHLAVIL